jgi:excinuclease UvrABC ATPase subunit
MQELGIGYLTLDRPGGTLSTGEQQRLELLGMAKSHSTGILYVLDEPSVGLHPANVTGLQNIMKRMVANGNSLIVVDHNLELIRGSDYMIEMGPEAGELKRRHSGTLYVLDEPSTGLHAHNIETLLGVLDQLMAEDSTVILIDHDPDLIANCDYVIDLGPGGGPSGGTIVAEGTPEQVSESANSITGNYLANRFHRSTK